MNVKRAIGISIIAPAFVCAIVHTACNKANTEKNLPETVINDSTSNVGKMDVYERARDAYARGAISAESFQQFMEKNNYVECGE